MVAALLARLPQQSTAWLLNARRSEKVAPQPHEIELVCVIMRRFFVERRNIDVKNFAVLEGALCLLILSFFKGSECFVNKRGVFQCFSLSAWMFWNTKFGRHKVFLCFVSLIMIFLISLLSSSVVGK